MKTPKVKVTTQKSKEEKYMQGTPTRAEVSEYVQTVLEGYYIPILSSQIQLSAMILQAILLDKKVCTKEEIKSVSEEFIKEHKLREMAIKNQTVITGLLLKASELQETDESMAIENGLCTRLKSVSKLLSNTEYSLTPEQKADIKEITTLALSALIAINEDKANKITDEDMRDIAMKSATLRTRLIKEGFVAELPSDLDNTELVFKSGVIHILTELVSRCSLGVNMIK